LECVSDRCHAYGEDLVRGTVHFEVYVTER
jgi:hypothetical protein